MTSAVHKLLVQIVFLVVILASTSFASVSRWNWRNASAYLGLNLVFLAHNAFILLGKQKELVEEYSQVGEGTKGWDKNIVIFTGIGAFLMISYLMIPMAPGWLWACTPVGLLVVKFILRTLLVDHTLLNQLDGFKEYAGQVRYRLLSGSC
jgi:hypothetical protein